jgi:hypothetical protein
LKTHQASLQRLYRSRNDQAFITFTGLDDEVDARVEISSQEEIAEYQDVVQTNFPAIDGSWCVMDRLKIPIEKSGDDLTQNAYYNGWLHDHFVGCVFVFVPLGVVVACALNAPGSWHDSKTAANCKLYNQLQSIYDRTSGIAVVDAAISKKCCPFMIEPGKHKPGKMPMQSTICRQATSLRQLAEWGMRAIQGSYPRLKDQLLFLELIEN